MKKYIVALFALAVMAVSCREFEPVFTLKYQDTPLDQPVTDEYALARFGADAFTTIADLKKLYVKHGEPVEIFDPIVIRGEVTSSDESGNVYREMFLQDATGAIDFKIGRSSSYDDYKPGQILYVNCNGLVLGEYGFKDRDYSGSGQLQLGLKRNMAMNLEKGEFEAADDYETSYIDLEPVLRAKVLKGAILPAEERIKPKSDITGAQILSYGYDEVVVQKKKPQQFQLSTNIQEPLVGMLVELKGLKYGNEVFTLFYPNPNLNHTSTDGKNRVFLSLPNENEQWESYDYTYGVPWWALTKLRFTKMVEGAKEVSGAILASMLITVFQNGSNYMSSVLGVAKEIASVITGILLLFSACGGFFRLVAKGYLDRIAGEKAFQEKAAQQAAAEAQANQEGGEDA